MLYGSKDRHQPSFLSLLGTRDRLLIEKGNGWCLFRTKILFSNPLLGGG